MAVATSTTITWTTSGTGAIPTVTLEVSPNGFADELENVTIATAVTNGSNTGCTAPAGEGCYMWTVADGTASVSAKVRVRHASDATVANTSSAFTLRGTIDTVPQPASSEVVLIGASKTITWTSTGNIAIPTVALEYSTNAFSD